MSRMPDGVVTPTIMANIVMARQAHSHYTEAPFSEQEKIARTKLMTAARAGDKKAIKALYKLYRLRITTECIDSSNGRCAPSSGS